jgi:hypothetical protein
MLEFETKIDLGKSSNEEFVASLCDYLGDSGFTDLDCSEGLINARKRWPSGSLIGTLATLSFFHTVRMEIAGHEATIVFGTIRTFLAMMIVIPAVMLAFLWWIPLSLRLPIGIVSAFLIYAAAVPLALMRAKFVLQHMALRHSG